MEVDELARVERLEQHIARLDREVALLRTRVGGDRPTETPRAPVMQMAEPTSPTALTGRATWPAPQPITEPPVDVARQPVRLSLDSESVLKWGGVGLVVLAVGFAVSTAISRDWIGPELQLAGALIVSAAFVAVGLRVRPTRPRWTHALCSGGVLAFFTTFASDLFLDRADEPVAFAATAAVAVGGLLLAGVIDSEWVAAATLGGGSIGWAVIAGGDDTPVVATLVWFVLFLGGSVLLSVDRRWFATRPLAHAIGMIAFLAVSGDALDSAESALLALSCVVLVGSLFVVPSIGDMTSGWQQLEIQLAALAAPWAFAVALASFLDDRSDNIISTVAFAIAAVTAVVALVLRDRIRRPHVVSLALGASVTASIGLAVLLSTTTVFVALAVQAAGLILLSRALGGSVRVLVNAAVLALIAVTNALGSMAEAWRDNASWGDDVAHLMVIGASAVGIWFLELREVRRAGAIMTLALVLLWTGSVFVHAPQGQAIVSISWATLGTVVFVVGAIRRRPDAATTGLAVIALTVGKLLTVDLREVDTLWRAGLFFLVGIGLLRLGFLLPRLTRTDASSDTNGDADTDTTADTTVEHDGPRDETSVSASS